MNRINKIFFYLGRPGAAEGSRRGSRTVFLGVLGALHVNPPHFHAPLDGRLVVQALLNLAPPESLFVIALDKFSAARGLTRTWRERGLAYWIKETRTAREGPLARYLPKRTVDARIIFQTSDREDLEWAVQRYGSLDKIRIFAVDPSRAGDLEMAVRHDSERSYGPLLDLSHFVALFDYDWEYFYILSRQLNLNRIAGAWQRVCRREGIETEVVSSPHDAERLRGRIERLVRVPVFS